jgi:hypothetical protein
VSAALQEGFTQTEAKLLRLLLCPSAAAGEVDSATRALVASWRKRRLMAETLLEPRAVLQRSSRPAFSPGDMLMPFGKCRGLPLRRIKSHYLRWVLQNCDDLQPELERAIHAVLGGNGN